MSERTVITATDAPEAIGPYSHAVVHGTVLYCSGVLPIEPGSGSLVDTDLATETEQCMRNLAAVCHAGGTELGRTLRTTIYTTDLASFAELNEAYGRFFPSEPPARVTVGVAALPKGARVEIDAMVAIE